MEESSWKGGKKDRRLYQNVRAERQRLIREKYDRLAPCMDEPGRRLWAGSEAIAFGHGGISAVAEALGMNKRTVMEGRRELESDKGAGTPVVARRQRRPGAGRKEKAKQDPKLVRAIEVIVDPATRGDPMSPLKWTSKSLAKISDELKQQGLQASAPTISKILHKDLKYNRQGLMKTKEGKQRPDRNA